MVRRVGEMKINTSPQTAALPFVGRVDELGRVVAALNLAFQGKGGTILLTGQPGIGKTRLAREAIALAREQGFAVVEGRAHLLEVGLAYAPIIEAFRPLLGSFDSSCLAGLTSDLPSLGRLFEDLRLPTPEPLGDPSLEKTRLFEAVARLLQRLTRQTPVALFIDDLQWADPATLELSYYLMRGVPDQRALVLASYASDAADATPGLRELVGSLLRDGLASEIAISPLDPDEVDKLVHATLGGVAPRDLLQLIDSRARGVPLYIEALIAALIDSGNLTRRGGGWSLDAEGAKTLPQGIRRLILQRLARLAPADRHILDLIAVIGRATSHTILQAASGLSEDGLIGVLQRLQAAGLVAEQMDGADVFYGISHPLVRDVAYGNVPAMARRRVHLAAIEALESSSKGQLDDIAGLARHYHAAGAEADRGRALAALVAAGDRLLVIYANEEAARHYGAALAIARESQDTGDREVCSSTLAELLERLGDAWERIGKRGAAVEVWNEALVLLSEGEAASDAVAASRLRGKLAVAESSRGHFRVAHAHVQAGLAVLQGRTGCNPCRELVDLHFARYTVLDRSGDASAVADATAEILAVSEQLGSPYAQASANLLACMFRLERGDIAGAREHALYALRVGEQAQELMICCLAQSMLVAIGMCLGDHRFMRYYAEHGLALARRLGAPEREIHLRQRLAYASFISGDWDASLQTIKDAVALARRVGSPRDMAYALAEEALILAWRGDLPEAAGCIADVRTAFGTSSREDQQADRYVFGLVDIAETALALEWGQAERALGIARSFIRPAGSATTVAGRAGLAPTQMPVGLMLLAEAQTAAGDPESAMETARDLIGLGPPGAQYLTALACKVEGLARQAIGDHEAAIARLTQAQEAFTGLEMPFDAARALLALALSVGKRPALSTSAAQQSLAIFERLGARRYADRARLLMAGLDVPPIAPPRHSDSSIYLSGRELEVALLAADGSNTNEIAQRLFLSPHTVRNHLHHVYARLGVSSRASLVRHMIDAGLVKPNNRPG